MATKRRILVQAGHMRPLDPGHSAQTGARGEADLVARIQKRLVAILEGDNRFDPLPMPGLIPKGTPADAAVFLHADGAANPKASGFSFGFPDPPINKKLADLIADEFTKIPGHPHRRPDNGTEDEHFYYGFNRVSSTGPETLVEHGFVSNPGEMRWMKDHVSDLARAEYNAICRFFGLNPAAGSGARALTATATAEPLTTTSTLLAPPRATQAQMRAHLIARHKAHHSQSIYKDSAMSHIVRLYFRTAKSIGLDPLVAVAQMELETGHLTSRASQPPQRNPAGIGITGAPGEGLSFPNWTKAVRAHVGRLAAYAIPKGKGTPEQKTLITEALNVRPLDDSKRGSAARLQGLSKNWAADPDYADKIVRVAKEIQEG
jgi:flagellum-specific peptidoglycan hydrolase FlgJ